jgi:glucosamine kinase
VPYYLGIDGGGTKTTCAVGDEAKTLATATAGPSNIVRVGEARARESLQQAVRQACASAGITPAQVKRTCVGGSGAVRPELAATVRDILGEVLSSPVDVVGDMEIALEAAFGSGPGVIVIAGTGSISYGRDQRGNTARAGGWGFAIGDEGSAHWIGREAIRAILRTSDRASDEKSFPGSNLAAALYKTWGVRSLDDLAHLANAVPPPDFASLFPTVAASKDGLALEVLSSAGLELAQIAAAVIRRLFPTSAVKTVPIAMIGSVFRHAARVKESFYNELRRIDPSVEISPTMVEPVEGALRMAREKQAQTR